MPAHFLLSLLMVMRSFESGVDDPWRVQKMTPDLTDAPVQDELRGRGNDFYRY